MQKYHYTDGVNTFGPFSIDELKSKGLTGDTFVWTEGMPNWVPARSVSELSELLSQSGQPYFTGASQVPPQFAGSTAIPNGQNLGRPPRTYLIESLLATLFCCLPLGIPSIIYASNVEKKFYAGDIVGAEQDSANARRWLWINLGVCVGLWILFFLIFGFSIFGVLMNETWH